MGLLKNLKKIFKRTFKRIFFRISYKLGNLIYWFKCHYLKKYKFHLLDLSQPITNTTDDYKYGWVDTDYKILFALFNLLNNFVDHELDGFYCPKQEDCLNDEGCQLQRFVYFEILELYNWWNFDRKKDLEEIKNLNLDYYNLKTQLLYTKAVKKFDNKEDEMIARLLKIRRYLWT